MLVFTLQSGQLFHIGSDIRVTIVEVKGGQVKVGIEAPREVAVDRDKVWLSKLRQPSA